MAKMGVFHDAWNVLFNLTATDGGIVVGVRSVTGRFVVAITDGVPFVGFILGYDGRAVENEFVLTKLDEVIKGGK